MAPSSARSVVARIPDLLAQWELFTELEQQLFELTDFDANDPAIQSKENRLVNRMADADTVIEEILQQVLAEDALAEFSAAYRAHSQDTAWTLPMLIRLNLRIARCILEQPTVVPVAPGVEAPLVHWEMAVIPAVGRREDLGAFLGPDASRALNQHGLAPPDGEAVVLGVSTPDALLAWLSEPELVAAWRQRCLENPGQLPVEEGLPLMEVPSENSNSATFGGYIYVVGMVARGTPRSLPLRSPITEGDFETVEAAWKSLYDQWSGPKSESLSITEPDEIWDGCVFAIGSTVLQTLYLQHAVGGTPYEDGEGPVFAIVANAETEAFQIVGLFPDGELVALSLEEDMVAFLPALMDSPEFEFDLVEASQLNEWVEECRGVDAPAAPIRPRLS